MQKQFILCNAFKIIHNFGRILKYSYHKNKSCLLHFSYPLILQARNGPRSSNTQQKHGVFARFKKWRKHHHDKEKRKHKIWIWLQQIRKQNTHENNKSAAKQKIPQRLIKKLHPFLPSGKQEKTLDEGKHSANAGSLQ